MKSLQAALALALAAAAPVTAPAAESGTRPLSPGEIQDGWRLLWDGKTTHGWRSVRGPAFPASGWQIRDGILTVLASEGKPGAAGGDIITVDEFSDFELLVDFRVTPGCNSGIKIFVDPEINRVPGASIGLEYQILDDERNADAKLGRDGNRTLGSLYDLYPPAADKRPNPVGEWNTALIVSRGPVVEHWLNGRRILQYTRFTPGFHERVLQSKFKSVPGFGELRVGHILLQDHGDEVSFRNIKIRELSAGSDTPVPARQSSPQP
jgi:hypothetical protein